MVRAYPNWETRTLECLCIYFQWFFSVQHFTINKYEFEINKIWVIFHFSASKPTSLYKMMWEAIARLKLHSLQQHHHRVPTKKISIKILLLLLLSYKLRTFCYALFSRSTTIYYCYCFSNTTTTFNVTFWMRSSRIICNAPKLAQTHSSTYNLI